MHPIGFISESIEVQFDRPPELKKKPGVPDQFDWQDETRRVVELLSEWRDYTVARSSHSSVRVSSRRWPKAAPRGVVTSSSFSNTA